MFLLKQKNTRVFNTHSLKICEFSPFWWKLDNQIGQFQAKNLIFLAIFILTKITFFVDGHRLMTYWFFLSSTYFLSEKHNFDSIKVIWGTFWGPWKFQINKEMLISRKECVIPKAPYSDFDKNIEVATKTSNYVVSIWNKVKSEEKNKFRIEDKAQFFLFSLC